MEQTAAAKWPLVLLGCCTCLAGMFAGALFGGASAALYHVSDRPATDEDISHDILTQVGVIAGVAAGLLAGGYWTLRMGRRISRGVKGRFRLMLAGGGWGVVVGASSALLTHVALNVAWAVLADKANLLAGVSFMAIGVAWGAVVGFFTGLACGVLALGATLRLRPDVYW